MFPETVPVEYGKVETKGVWLREQKVVLISGDVEMPRPGHLIKIEENLFTVERLSADRDLVSVHYR